MINFNEDTIRKHKGFEKSYDNLIKHPHLQSLLQLGISNGRKRFPMSNHVAVDSFQQNALRDSYTQGAMDLMEYLYGFMKVKEEEQLTETRLPTELESATEVVL